MIWVRKLAMVLSVLSLIALLTGVAVAARPLPDFSKMKSGEVYECLVGKVVLDVKYDEAGKNYFIYTFEDERAPFVVAVEDDDGTVYAWADRNRDGKVDIEGNPMGDNDLAISLCAEAEKAAEVRPPAKRT